MNIENFTAGLKVLMSAGAAKEYCIGSEHDVFYVYADPVPPNVVELMASHGWCQELIDFDDDWTAENYDPESSWAAYV